MQTVTYPENKQTTDPGNSFRAAVLTAPKQFDTQELPLPELMPRQVLIRMQGCGLCASSIPVWEGREWFDYPQEAGAPGHEGFGIVEKTGSKVTEVQAGDRVAALSYHAYAEFDIAGASQVVKLPEELNDMPFPGEPLGCAMNIFERSDIREGHTVAILGIGFLGSLLIQLAKSRGAKVIAVSRRGFSRQTAREMGADEVIDMEDYNLVKEEVKRITGDSFCDRVIECTGKEGPLNLAGELSRVRGKLIIAGFHQGGMRSVNIQLWNWRGLDVINAHERDPQEYVKGMKKAVQAVLAGQMDPRPLFTHLFPAEEIKHAHSMLCNRPEGFIKGIISW